VSKKKTGVFFSLSSLFFLPSTSPQPPFAAKASAAEAFGSKKTKNEGKEGEDEKEEGAQRERAGPVPRGHSPPPPLSAAPEAEAGSGVFPPPRPLLRTGLLLGFSAVEEE